MLVANLMQRYNPVYDAVNRLIQAAILGELLHGYFENYASDENLPPEHWFWDPAKSGGIFIEHGVHFFDLFAGWLGAGSVVAAEREHSPRLVAADRGTSPVHGALRSDGPGQLLSWLPPSRPDGPAGAAAGLRAGRRDSLRLGSDQGAHPRDRRRSRDTRPLRALPGRAARCLGDLFGARTEPARAATRHSTFTR